MQKSMTTLKKVKIKNTILAIIVSVVAIFVPSFFMGKWIEGAFFFLCHWLIREQFPYQYHCPTHALCRLLTSLVFFFGVTFVVPITYSFLSAIPICYFISWVGYTKKRLALAENKLNYNFDCETCTESELRERCRLKGFTPENTEMAVELFIKKITRKEFASKYFVEIETVKSKKRRLRQKLNKDSSK